jgi:hypothetical protein
VTRVCGVADCDRPHEARDLCAAHYARWASTGIVGEGAVATADIKTTEAFTACPAGPLLELAAQAAELDARRIFRVLWRAIGEWHLAGLSDRDGAA